jgi:hypothetical protein
VWWRRRSDIDPLFGIHTAAKMNQVDVRKWRATMSDVTIEERVSRLERLVEQLLQAKSNSTQPGRDDWQRTFGMFAGDPVMKEIIEAGRRIREEDRRQTDP